MAPGTVPRKAVPRPYGKSRKVENLANQVDKLSDEVAQIKALLQNLQPAQGVPAAAPAAAQPTYTEDDMLSTAASCSLFAEEEEQAALASQAFSQGSLAEPPRDP